MKKSNDFLSFILTVVLFSSWINAQSPKLLGPPGGTISDIYILPSDPSIIFAGTRNGGLFYNNLSNGRQTYIETYTGDYTLQSLFVSADTDNIFLYSEHYFIHTSLISKQVTLIYNNLGYHPTREHFIVNPHDENVMYMHKYGTEIWRSNDQGDNWYKLHTFEEDIDRIAIAPSDSSILYVASGKELFKSIDSGENWFIPFSISFAFQTEKIKINPQNPNTTFLKSGGNLYRATGSGTNVDTTIIYNLKDFLIDHQDTLIIYAAASDPWSETGGGMIKSIDYGESWFSIIDGIPNNGTNITKLEMDPINSEVIYAGTFYNGIYKTENGGESWEHTKLLSDDYIGNYEIIDGQNGEIICLSYGFHLLKTHDGGQNWSKPQFLPEDSPSFLNYEITITFHPINREIGFKADGTYLLKTTDGGDKWNRTDLLPNCIGIQFNNYHPEIIYAKDSGKMRYISEDGGNTWRQLTRGILPIVFSPTDKNVAYLHFPNALARTSNKGETWEQLAEDLPKDNEGYIKPISDLVINEQDPNILYVSQTNFAGPNSSLSRSKDGGITWNQVDSSLLEIEPKISISSICIDKEFPNRLFVGSYKDGEPFSENFYNGGLYLTEDDCKTWRKLYDSYTDNIKIDYTTTPKTIYFTTKFGLMSLPDTAHVTDVVQTKPVLPNKFVLEQNYPNPFNPSTTIKYNLPSNEKRETTNVKLIVYDVLGKEIITLVNKQQKPGNYKVEFDATELTSGIYFYRMRAGEFAQTKKMLLMK